MQLVRNGNRAHTLHLHSVVGAALEDDEEEAAVAAAMAAAEVAPPPLAPLMGGRWTFDDDGEPSGRDRSSVRRLPATVAVADSDEGSSFVV